MHSRPFSRILFLRSRLLRVLALPALLLSQGAAGNTSLADCALIRDDALRLGCYDALAAAQAAVTDPTANNAPEQELLQEEGPGRKELLAGERLRQEEATAYNAFVLTPHHRNYLLPVTYNARLNEEPWDLQYPGEDMQETEAKFQFSVKALVWKDIFGEHGSLWAGYTQQNWWQVYNESSPFRETNYQPEAFLTFANDWQVLGFTNTVLSLGINHQSNGQGGDLSRSWNRVMAGAVFERERMTLSARAWYRLPEKEEDDDNPDILDYYGYGDLTGVWKYRQHEFSLMVRNNLRSDNKGAVEAEWSFPISPRFKGYVQYFYGYGESLIDHDHLTNRIGIGISLTDLL
ncbi:phospholipase A [Parahaliea maris]|uniref:Phospholipase A1 n=1 Tax=Parahaliea maris TaxID=2716870 RepID=A0A5C9A3S8_9GAMM|nr:phospholipase A [Parahaliea maris]TXS95535.1 phospholipase A [Parahaliea maris]